MTALSKFSPAERFLIAILSAIHFTHVLDFVIMMPLGPTLIRALDLKGPREFAILVSAYTFSAAVSGLIGAFFLNRVERKRALLTAYVGFIFGTVLCGLARNYVEMLGARITAGAFGGIIGAMIFSILGDAFPDEKRGRATGFVMGSFSIASVLGIPLGLKAAALFDWHAPFLGLSCFSLLVLAFARTKLPEFRQHLGAESRYSLKVAFRQLVAVVAVANHRRASLLTASLMMAGFLVIPMLAPFLVKNVGVPEYDLFLVYLCGGLATAVSSPLIGRFADRHGKYLVFTLVAFLSIAPILMVTNLGQVTIAAALAVTTMFMVFVGGRFVPCMAIVTSAAKAEHRGGFLSLNGAIQSAAAGVASYALGYIVVEGSDGRLTGYSDAGLLAVGFTLLSIWLAGRVRSQA